MPASDSPPPSPATRCLHFSPAKPPDREPQTASRDSQATRRSGGENRIYVRSPKGSNAVYVRTTEQGSVTIVVPVQKGRTLKRGTLHGLIDDMGLSTKEFIDLL